MRRTFKAPGDVQLGARSTAPDAPRDADPWLVRFISTLGTGPEGFEQRLRDEYFPEDAGLLEKIAFHNDGISVIDHYYEPETADQMLDTLRRVAVTKPPGGSQAASTSVQAAGMGGFSTSTLLFGLIGLGGVGLIVAKEMQKEEPDGTDLQRAKGSSGSTHDTE